MVQNKRFRFADHENYGQGSGLMKIQIFSSFWFGFGVSSLVYMYKYCKQYIFLFIFYQVKWFRISEKQEELCEPLYLHTSEISVYDLQKQQKYQFRPGSIVYPVQKSTNSTENKIGHVLDSYPEGFIIVNWMDGTETKCWPQNLMLLPEAEYDIITETSTDYPPGSWETESEISIEGDNGQDDLGLALIATKLDFIRNKMVYLKDVFKQQRPADNILVSLYKTISILNVFQDEIFNSHTFFF